MVAPVRLGIIGCGDVMAAYLYNAQILRGQGLLEITAASDPRPDRLQMMQDRYAVPFITQDYQELIQSKEVDLILVLTSMNQHGPIALQALKSGKHVLVEKPMAVTLEEAAQLVHYAKASPGYLLCAPHVILSPTYQMIWRHVQNGEIGKVLLARARYGHAGPTWGPWYYRQGGGALFDLAPYNLTSLTGLLGAVQRVTAMVGTAILERAIDEERVEVEVEDNAHILLDFGENVFAVVTTGFTMQQYRCPAIELYGASGTLQMLGDDWDPEGYELWQNEVGAWKLFKETDPGWLWTDGLRHLVQSINEGTPPIITPEHAYHVLEIMVKAKEAAREGTSRQIESRFPSLQISPEPGAHQAQHLIHDRTHQR